MFDEKKHKFLFKCQDCGMIVAVELEDEQDIENAYKDEFCLECVCEGKSKPLRN